MPLDFTRERKQNYTLFIDSMPCSQKYSLLILRTVCRESFPGTRSVRGGKIRRPARSPEGPKTFLEFIRGKSEARKPHLGARQQK